MENQRQKLEAAALAAIKGKEVAIETISGKVSGIVYSFNFGGKSYFAIHRINCVIAVKQGSRYAAAEVEFYSEIPFPDNKIQNQTIDEMYFNGEIETLT